MKTKLIAIMAVVSMGIGLLAAPAMGAQDDDHWDSRIDMQWTMKSRTMKDADGDYKAIFDQENTARSDCHGGGNQIVITLYKEDGWWDDSQGSKNISKDCVRRSQSWWTNHGGDEMYYHIRNRDAGRAIGEFDSRDA